jgi:hypothetical protein
MPARAFPDPLPGWVRDHPLRRAEVKVYDALRSQLSSRYTVFYSRPWIGTNPDGTEKDGEADFVIAAAETGFLVLEVKGGGVGRDAKADAWYSIDQHGCRHSIKNPVFQAGRSKHELLERLKSRPELAGRWIGAGIAVVLPDCTGKEALEGVDVPPDHFALREDMERLGHWVVERLESTVGEKGGELGPGGVKALEHLVANSFLLRIPLASTIDSDHERVIAVTEQQYALLDFLERHNRVAVAGAAGSGKTVLALYKALQLAAAHPSSRVLLTCYNAPLAAWLRRAARRAKNLEVASFHDLCSNAAKSAGLGLDDSHKPRFFSQILPEALVESVARRPDTRFDAIVVDEGQDFEDGWLDGLQLCLRDAQSTFWVFYDDNQRLYDRPGSLLEDMPQAPFVLKKNVRNPRPVFERLLPLIGDATVVPLGPSGRSVEEVVVPKVAVLPGRLAALATRLVEDEQVDPEDIAILVERAEQIETICPGGSLARIGTCRAHEEPRGRICVDTVRRFKGLERKVIVIVQPADLAHSDELLYVGLSRATGHLILIGDRMPLSTADS